MCQAVVCLFRNVLDVNSVYSSVALLRNAVYLEPGRAGGLNAHLALFGGFSTPSTSPMIAVVSLPRMLLIHTLPLLPSPTGPSSVES